MNQFDNWDFDTVEEWKEAEQEKEAEDERLAKEAEEERLRFESLPIHLKVLIISLSFSIVCLLNVVDLGESE